MTHWADVDPVPALVGCLVLVVEDDAPLRQLFKLQLSKTPGLCVETASDGEEAVRLARELRPDVILMDVVMPVVDGFEAVRCLMESEATARIPVIAVTGAAFEPRRIRESGFDGCLFKPVMAQDMIQEIARVLERFGRV